MTDQRIIRYLIAASAFLQRSKTALAAYDLGGDVSQLLLAALVLRLGIEARLFEYISAELPSEGREKQLTEISEYQATKLLSRLTRLNADAKQGLTVRMTPADKEGPAVALRYTPMTDSLARVHGKLGEFLHINYFHKNPHWYVNAKTERGGLPTLPHVRELIEQGQIELQQVASGDLLNHPRWRSIVQEMVDDIEHGKGID